MTVAQALKKHCVAYTSDMVIPKYILKFTHNPMMRSLAQTMLFNARGRWIGFSILRDLISDMAIQHRVKMVQEALDVMRLKPKGDLDV